MTQKTLFALRQPLMMAALALPLCWPAHAGANPFDEPTQVRVHLPGPARDEAMARRGIDRLGKAALAACGGSQGSLAEVKAAVRQSACWHAAMDRAVDQSADARLRAWWAAHPS